MRRATRAEKEHKTAVNKMKKGNSFGGYTDISWNAANKNQLDINVHIAKHHSYSLISIGCLDW